MSDDATPAWATAMESRLTAVLDTRLTAVLDARLAAAVKDLRADSAASAMSLRGEIAASTNTLRAELVTTRADIMARIDRLQHVVESIKDDITVNYGRADRAVDAVVGIRRDLQALASEVTAMERQIRRLRADVDTLKDGH